MKIIESKEETKVILKKKKKKTSLHTEDFIVVWLEIPK